MYAVTDESFSYSLLNRAECVFAALWNSREGAIATDAVARYYEVPEQLILDTLQARYQEFESELKNGEWTPRAAIRMGLFLESPIAVSVRSLALDFVEAHKQPTKKAAVKFLLENTQFVEWSNREIGRILECSHTVVNEARRELENKGKVLPFEKRKFKRGETVSEQSVNKSHLETHLPDETGNPDSAVKKLKLGAKVKVASDLHPRYGEEGEIIKEWDLGHWQVLVGFADGEEIAIAYTDLDATSVPFPRSQQSVERKIPKQYEEAIAQLKQQHEEELQRLKEEIKIGLKTEAEELAKNSVREQLEMSQAIANSKGKEIAELYQKIEKLEGLRSLEVENEKLKQRIQDLEHSQEDRGTGWGNTYTKQAEKALNAEVVKMVKSAEPEPELHLRSLAKNPPTNVEECLQLMTMAIANLASAINSTQVLSAAAILLECEANREAIANQKNRLVFQAERNVLADEAVSEIRKGLSIGYDWGQLQAIAAEYAEIKSEYWAKLSLEEQALIRKLNKDFNDASAILQKQTSDTSQELFIQKGSIVCHADEYNILSQVSGTVLGIENDMILVHWQGYEKPLFQHRYEPEELKLVEV